MQLKMFCHFSRTLINLDSHNRNHPEMRSKLGSIDAEKRNYSERDFVLNKNRRKELQDKPRNKEFCFSFFKSVVNAPHKYRTKTCLSSRVS
ncbi:unnamed protein product [Chironomus riparius]|uniref:Uncharacterized protein n=1 Tax=Chironomus riparius TaxID=315576 RepID=A0A9N9WQ14_9DIPT|nr:unnamed protein product [Chironomus riparius]